MSTRLAGIAVLCASVGCNALFDIESLPGATEAGQCTVSPAARALSATFPNFSAECAACLQTQCACELDGCVGDGGCADFTACRWGAEFSPGNELRCEVEHQRSLSEARSVTWQLENCVRNGCALACQHGTQWDCAGQYAFPPPDSGTSIAVTQTLQMTDGAPLAGATVHFCGPLIAAEACAGQAVSSATTDAEGVARATLPVGGSLGGWTGYREIEHPAMFPARLQSNLIIPRSRYLLQQVVERGEADTMARRVGADTALGNILFQVFDCAHTGAEGILIEASPAVPGAVIRDPTSVLEYTASNTRRFELDAESTHTEGAGSGVLSNVIPNELIDIQARRATGEVVATLQTLARPGELLLLEIHPNSR